MPVILEQRVSLAKPSPDLDAAALAELKANDSNGHVGEAIVSEIERSCCGGPRSGPEPRKAAAAVCTPL
jgi:hypothetical protein